MPDANQLQREAKAVISRIQSRLIGDGYELVFDFAKSHGSWIHDSLSGDDFLDFYTFFASLPLGFRHPDLVSPAAAQRLAQSAVHKPANSDSFSRELASFVDTFSRIATPDGFEHLFFIEGGALAVENALKVAFDWKTRKNQAAGRSQAGDQILHFEEAFHGRSGYTLSLTNTDPIKTAFFPKFDWPRVHNPKLRFPVDESEVQHVEIEEQRSLREIESAFAKHPHRIAGIIIEPIQGEGGDNHFRGEFFTELRRIADDNEALLIFDEVQTGLGSTGKMWAWEHFGVAPDVLCFGKKAQVCGLMAGSRIDEVPNNVFRESSRINSTWGGGLTDMVRCEMILGVLERDQLIERSARLGERFLRGLHRLAERFPDQVDNARGRGLFCAFDCPSGDSRQELIDKAKEERLLVLPCGSRSIRVRPALTVSESEIDEGLARLTRALSSCAT